MTEGEGARITESRGEKDWENPAEKRYGEEKCEGYKSDRVRQREVGVVFHGWLNLCLSLPEAFKLATSSIHWHHGVTLSSSPLHMFYTHSYCNCGCTSWMHPGAQYTGVPLEHVLLGQPTQVGPKVFKFISAWGLSSYGVLFPSVPICLLSGHKYCTHLTLCSKPHNIQVVKNTLTYSNIG